MTYRALDLFSGAGGMGYGLELAGFEVTGVDIKPQPHHRGGAFILADAMEVLREREYLRRFDLIHASPPCQAYTSLRHLSPGKVYPDLIAEVRRLLIESGRPYSIENVSGAPLGGWLTLPWVMPDGRVEFRKHRLWLTMLCGTMFGLQTPDGRAEIRRHRLFETSFSIALRPQCQHGQVQTMTVTGENPRDDGLQRRRRASTLVVTGHSYQGADAHSRRRALSVTGHAAEISPSNWGARQVITVSGDRCNSSNTPRKVLCVAGGKAMSGGMMTPQGTLKIGAGGAAEKGLRERFSIDDARAAMGIPWMPMSTLSQAIPPAYGKWIGEQAIRYLDSQKPVP